MNRYIIVLFIGLAFLTGKAIKAQDSEELVTQLKVVRMQLWEVSPIYHEVLDFTIIKLNETFNNVFINFIAKEDFPHDIYFYFDVYVTDSEYENSTFLLSEEIPICENSPNRELLSGLMVPEADMDNNCFKKGLTLYQNIEVFRFDVLVPNIHEISDYHYYHAGVRTENEVLSNMTFYTQWGYL